MHSFMFPNGWNHHHHRRVFHYKIYKKKFYLWSESPIDYKCDCCTHHDFSDERNKKPAKAIKMTRKKKELRKENRKKPKIDWIGLLNGVVNYVRILHRLFINCQENEWIKLNWIRKSNQNMNLHPKKRNEMERENENVHTRDSQMRGNQQQMKQIQTIERNQCRRNNQNRKKESKRNKIHNHHQIEDRGLIRPNFHANEFYSVCG